MKIVVTSITAPEVSAVLRAVTVPLEAALNRVFASDSYGGQIEQFTVSAVAVDSDATENLKWCKDRIGSIRNPVTGEKIKNMSVALPFDPTGIASMNEEGVRQLVSKALILKVSEPELRIPKDFDYVKFSDKLRLMLEIYTRASLETTPLP